MIAETVRPMLLHGLPARKDESGDSIMDEFETPQRRGAHFLGQAMELLLPAFDANDEDKMLAALSFYTSVFSNCTALCGTESMGNEAGAGEAAGHGALNVGIDLETWACDFMRRVFTAVDTLQSGKDSASMGDDDTCAAHTVLRVLCSPLFTNARPTRGIRHLPFQSVSYSVVVVKAGATLCSVHVLVKVSVTSTSDLALGMQEYGKPVIMAG